MQGIKRYWLLIVLGLAIDAPLQATTREPAQVIVKSARTVEPFHKNVPFEIDLGSSGVCEIKLIDLWGLPIVEVEINKTGPFKFLVDTGADLSVVSNELIQKLQLKAIESKTSQLHTSHQKATISTSLYILDEIHLGQAFIKNAPFIGTNTAEDDFLLLKNLNIVGILGANIFHDIVLTLNFPQQQIKMSQHQNASSKGNTIKLHENYYIPVIQGNVKSMKDETSYDFLIDTGYSGFIKMPVCFNEDKKANQQNKVVTYDIFNEQVGGFLAELDGTLTLGDKAIENPLVKYNIGHCEQSQKWGLIGTSFLKHQPVSIDQKNREVIIH